MMSNDILKVMVVGLLLASSGASASSIVNDVNQVVSMTGSIAAMDGIGATVAGTTGTWHVWRRGAFVHWHLRGSVLEAGGDVKITNRGLIRVGSAGLDKALHGLLFPGSVGMERAFRGSRNNGGDGQISIAAVESVQLTEPGSLALIGLGIAVLVVVRGRKRQAAAA